MGSTNTSNPPFDFVSEYRPDNGHEGEDAHQLPVGQAGGLYFAVAFEAGVIEGPFNQPSGPGWVVKIRADDNYLYKYFHLHSDPAFFVRVGQRVQKGQVIGLVGNSGNASGKNEHVHFEMWGPNNPDAQNCPFKALFYNYAEPGEREHNGVPLTGFADAYQRLGGSFPSARGGGAAVSCFAGSCGTTYVHSRNGVSMQAFNGRQGEVFAVNASPPGQTTQAGLVYGAILAEFKSDGGSFQYGRARDAGRGIDEYSYCAGSSRAPYDVRANDFTGAGDYAPQRIVWSAAYGAFNIYGGAYFEYVAGNGPCGFGPPIGPLQVMGRAPSGRPYEGFYSYDVVDRCYHYFWHELGNSSNRGTTRCRYR